MSIFFDQVGVAQRGTGATVSLPRVGSIGDLIIVVLGVEDVLASSGPWVDPYTGTPHSDTAIGPASGWKQACWQAPFVDGGCGLEVWVAISEVAGGSGTSTLDLVSSESFVCQQFYYTGAYAPDTSIGDGAERAAL